MPCNQPKRNKIWRQAYQTLHRALQREITLMRELLTALCEEEHMLLQGDLKSQRMARQVQSDLIVELATLRNERMDATALVTQAAVIQNQTELLPIDHSQSVNITNCIDQMLSLCRTMNAQNCQNNHIFASHQAQAIKPVLKPEAPKRRRVRTKTLKAMPPLPAIK